MGEHFKLMVVGASGFIGRALLGLMTARGIRAVAVSRHGPEGSSGLICSARIADYEDRHELAKLARGCDAAIVLAGRAHVLKDEERDSTAAFMLANRDVPVAVAEAVAEAGGRRLLFVSSVAVHGLTKPERPLREADLPAPVNDYGRSKLEGEQALERRCGNLGLELVILRPPLVYGPGAPGNFGQLVRAAKRGVPLPLGSIRNRRDFIGVDNLADLLLLAARHPAAAGQTFLVSDGEETSTAAVARQLYEAAGYGRRLLPVPSGLLRLGAAVLGRPEIAARLLDDLRIDSSHVRSTLGWHAPVKLAQGLLRSIRGRS